MLIVLALWQNSYYHSCKLMMTGRPLANNAWVWWWTDEGRSIDVFL